MIQNRFFSYTLEEFAQILDKPCEGACVFTDKWSLDDLAYGVPRDGPYQTNPPSPGDIISYIRNYRECQVTCTSHKQEIDVQDHQILTREIVSAMKPLEEIIQENVFCLGDEQRGGLLSLGKGIRNLLRKMKKPSNPQPLQSHPSLDITLSLSPFKNLETPSPPSSPQPQPPIMSHPLYYNYHDYHGSTCICCSHNQNLFLTLRDEMNIMFAHLEYLLTTTITSHFPPQP
ncbi:hypothetical protein Tco_0003044 [Tanacetum coccineum]